MGSKAAKETIVSDNTGLVWSIARRFMNRGYDLEELYQIGCIGLLKAVDRFETRFGVQFSTYAVPLIQGEIKRFLRDNGAIKISRILKQNGYHISQARQRLMQSLGRDATMEELCMETGLSAEEIVLATEANREVESIQQPVSGAREDGALLEERLVDESHAEIAAENIMNKMMIQQAMKQLNETERRLIELRFFEEKTQNEVARQLQISQVQVSRLEKKLLLRMRKALVSL
ncbi:MAG: sigma-70 family RNA polymerase sigma factor [Wujia sp.]